MKVKMQSHVHTHGIKIPQKNRIIGYGKYKGDKNVSYLPLKLDFCMVSNTSCIADWELQCKCHTDLFKMQKRSSDCNITAYIDFTSLDQ